MGSHQYIDNVIYDGSRFVVCMQLTLNLNGQQNYYSEITI